MQERKSIRPTFSAEGIFGGTLLAVRSNEFICFYDWAECRVVRRIDVVVKVRASAAFSCQILSYVDPFCSWSFIVPYCRHGVKQKYVMDYPCSFLYDCCGCA